jgi:hypothetical protein
VLLVAGEPNPAARELWETSARRAFAELDGRRRVLDVVAQLRPVMVDGQRRHMIYPGEDPRVVRVLQKIIRGLCHYHGVGTAIREDRVTADVLKDVLPTEWVDALDRHHREADVVEYRYCVWDDAQIHSGWLLTFFESRTFLGIVYPNGNLTCTQKSVLVPAD